MIEEFIKRNVLGIDKEKAEKLESARRFLGDVPEGIRIDDNSLTSWANEYGVSICYPQQPAQREDGWYMNMPGGSSYKVAEFTENPPAKPPRRYLMYEPGGRVSSTEFVPEYAVEVRRSTLTNTIDSPKEKRQDSEEINEPQVKSEPNP